MRRFVVREVETLKTTAAMYGLVCADGCYQDEDGWHCNEDLPQ